MPESAIHADPERLKEIVRSLPVFSKDLAIGLSEITDAFQKLGNTWRDDEYDRFKKCLDPLRLTIDEMAHELARQQDNLQKDVDNLMRYRQLNQ